ncbi:MAG TPA: hypothetical protein VNO75_09400 [Gemmatimonadaceae bacterium]|nr:hypothetical protein [Gemmatimonadaceae bacterium]
MDTLSIGIQQPVAVAASSSNAPSTFSLAKTSLKWGWGVGVGAAGVGMVVDYALCKRYHADEPSYLFPRCFMPAGGGTATGYFGGAIVGATIGAARAGRKRGCPSREATFRALAGAALGVTPGLMMLAWGGPDKYPPENEWVAPAIALTITTAPLLAGVGAAAAVVTCRTS